MEMQFENLLSQVTDFIKSEAKSETIVGQPFTLGNFECIPVIRVGLGFGTGGGEGDAPKKAGHGEAGGLGAGMGIEPIGFLVSKESEISFISTKTNQGLSAAFEKVPELIDKYFEMKKQPVEEVA